MRLGWSKNDKSECPQQDYDISHNDGQLLGRLDEILPFIYIAQYGASNRDMREQMTEEAAGTFAVGKQTGDNRPSVAPRVGLILPIAMYQP